MKKNEIRTLYYKILENRQKKDYAANLYIINKYLENGYGVFDWLLKSYVVALAKCKQQDELKKNVAILKKCFPDCLSTFDEIGLYIISDNYDEVFELIGKNNLSAEENLKIGIKLLSNGQYNMALLCLNRTFNMTDNNFLKERSKYYIDMISGYFKEDNFIRQNYQYFIDNGGEIVPGLVINGFVDNKDNRNKNQEIANKRLHVVLERNKDKIYCLPLINIGAIEEKKFPEYSKYILLGEDYPCMNMDYVVTDKIESISIDKVYSVYSRLLPEDYYDIYQMVTTSRKDYINRKKLFKIKK